MVLVRHEIAVRAKAPQNNGNLNAGSSVERSAARDSLSGGVVQKAAFPAEFQSTINSNKSPGDELVFHQGSYQTQLHLLEQQNKRRLLAARQEQREMREEQALEELSRTSREGYYLQQMAVEREDGRNSLGKRPHLPTLGSGSRNQGHDAQETGGMFRTQGQISQLAQLKMLEEEDEKRYAMSRDRSASPRPTRRESEPVWDGRNGSVSKENQMQWKELDGGNKESFRDLRRNDMDKQTSLSKSAPQNIPTITQDRWGMGLLQTDQGTTSSYEAEVMALENQRGQEAAGTSQTEIEFGEQRCRYLTEEAEISRFSGLNLPGAPGSSCSPPDVSLDFRAMPRPDVEFDELYHN